MTDDLKALMVTTARIEERVSHVQSSLSRLGHRLTELESDQHAVASRLSLLEGTGQRWAKWADLFVKAVAIVAVSWLCWRLGFAPVA